MTKDRFLTELENKLKRLPERERREAIEYYREYFADAGSEREQEVIAALKSPAHVASKILAEFASKKLHDHTQNADDTLDKKKRASTSSIGKIIVFMLLALFAAPIALPVLVLVAVCIFLVLITLGLVGIALFVCVFVFGILAVLTVFHAPLPALLLIGGALCALGCMIAVFQCVKFFISFILRKLSRRK